MDQNAIFNYCKTLGCCRLCCIRYMGVRSPKAYESPTEFCEKFENGVFETNGKGVNDSNDSSPPTKRLKINVCVSCLGILNEELWKDSLRMTKDVLEKKRYDCDTFACALSAPIATLLREKAIILRLLNEYPDYDTKCLTPLKEAWKWSFGVKLAAHISKTLDSGAVSPLLLTIHMDYVDDLQESHRHHNPHSQGNTPTLTNNTNTNNTDARFALTPEHPQDELEVLRKVAPELFEERNRQRRRFTTEFTRRSVEQALEMATLSALNEVGGGLPQVGVPAHCASVHAAHEPRYLGARYVKVSRNLPQSPWILEGKRVLPSSVQEIIFAPIAKAYNLSADEAESRLKFIAAGREDVDVRCLGDGRPFAIEVTDPTRSLTSEELKTVCQEINKSGEVVVEKFSLITKEDLTQLKKGEETKCKTYEALCIKLSHTKQDKLTRETPITVTKSDIERINSFRNTDEGTDVKINIKQKTPIRVLHRRPLLTRVKSIMDLKAEEVPRQPQLFKIKLRTSAGTYVKEWVHGDFGRSRPALGEAIGAHVDLLALDVTAVHLEWPPNGQ